jgi:hypothetical protein
LHKKKCFFSERNAILAQRAFRPHLDRGESQALTQHRRAYVVDEKRYATEGSEQSTHFLTQSFQCQTNPVATSSCKSQQCAHPPPPECHATYPRMQQTNFFSSRKRNIARTFFLFTFLLPPWCRPTTVAHPTAGVHSATTVQCVTHVDCAVVSVTAADIQSSAGMSMRRPGT